jgi:O-antigen/teichoic acid export membrane protein
MAGKSAEVVTLVLLATVVPRVLGPVDYGRFSVPLTVVTVGSLALTLGGPTTMARYVPAAAPGERPALARRLGGRLARGRAVQLGVLALLAIVAGLWRGDLFPPFVTACVLLAIALNVLATLGLQVGLGLGRTAAWSTRYPVQNVVLVTGVLLLYGLAGERGSLAALVLAGAAAAGLGAIVAAPVVRAPAVLVDLPDGAIRFGMLQAGGAACMQLAHRGGVLAVAVLGVSAAETGYAALAIGIALGVTYAVQQAFTVSLPLLATAGSDGGDPEPTLRRLAGGFVAVLVPPLLVVALALDRLVPLVFGDEYRAAVPAFGPALAAVVLAPLNALTVQVSALRFQPRLALACGIVAVVAFTATALVAVPLFGAPGGTAAGLAGVAAAALLAVVLVPKAIGGWLAAASVGGAALVLAAAAASTV